MDAKRTKQSNAARRRGEPIRVLLVDDHPIYARGLADAIALEPDITCVGGAQSGPEALALTGALKPDVVVLDVMLPHVHGPDLVRLLRQASPKSAIIALTGSQAGDIVLSMIRSGTDGYLLKSAGRQEIVDAIRATARGESSLSPSVAHWLIAHLRRLGEDVRTADDMDLTHQQLCVLRLLASGKGTREIAADLALSERTVENHLRGVYQKLDVSDRTHAVVVAVKRGYVRLSALNPIAG